MPIRAQSFSAQVLVAAPQGLVTAAHGLDAASQGLITAAQGPLTAAQGLDATTHDDQEQRPFRFLDLPAEIRITVYKAVLASREFCVPFRGLLGRPISEAATKFLDENYSRHALLETCRQIRTEAHPLRYEKAKVELVMCGPIGSVPTACKTKLTELTLDANIPPGAGSVEIPGSTEIPVCPLLEKVTLSGVRMHVPSRLSEAELVGYGEVLVMVVSKLVICITLGLDTRARGSTVDDALRRYFRDTPVICEFQMSRDTLHWSPFTVDYNAKKVLRGELRKPSVTEKETK